MKDNVQIFISHHSNSTRDFCDELSELLDTYEIRHWYAERDMLPMQNHANVLPETIKNSSLFVLLLNAEANASIHVEREVNLADANKIPILIAQLDYSEEASFVKYVKSTSQCVNLCGLNRVLAVEQLAKTIAINSNTGLVDSSDETEESRTDNTLDFFADEGERNRLKSQHSFFYEFAKDCYDTFLSSVSDATFLDVGCSTAEQAMMFCKGRKEIKNFVGIDREESALEFARTLYPEGRFYNCRFEDDDFDKTLSDIETALNIEGFDIINISMVLLHVKEPLELLDTLAGHLKVGGRFVILDIDDGFNLAYPDENGAFKRAVEICSKTEYSGCRESGRQIYKMLSEIDMKYIQLHKIGLSTVGMCRERREEFFNIYFWIILDDLRKMHSEKPENAIISSHLSWMEKEYKTMKRDFKNKEFYFNLGVMLFSAVKTEE